MLNPNQNETAVWICIGIITGVPFYFKNWLERTRPILAEIVQKKTSSLSGIIFLALFIGGFAFSRDSQATAMVLLFASIVSFSFLYQFAGHYQTAMNRAIPEPLTRHKASLRQNAGRLLIGAALCFLFSRASLAIFVIPFLIPFLTPLFIRLQYASTQMSGSPLKSSLLERFADEGVGLANIYIIDDPNSNQKNAFITGSLFGSGPFGRTLFLTLDLIRSLDESELMAVTLHEAAHLKQNHSLKRILAAVGLMVLCTFWITLPVVFLLPGSFVAMSASILATVFAQAFLLSRVISKQEHEADLLAIRMGASSNALSSALSKLSNGTHESEHRVFRVLSGNLYPTLKARISSILDCETPDSAKWIRHPSHALAYSLLVMGVVFWSANVRAPQAKISHSEDVIAGR